MEIVRLEYNSSFWKKAIDFAENCSWVAGKHIAGKLRENQFTDWEAFFISIEDDNIIGYCSFLKEDYFPENKYFPWISSVSRGAKVYIPSDMKGFYEKCGFKPIDLLKNYGGDMDTIFICEI